MSKRKYNQNNIKRPSYLSAGTVFAILLGLVLVTPLYATPGNDITYSFSNNYPEGKKVVVSVPGNYNLLDTGIVEEIYRHAASIAVTPGGKGSYTQYSYTKILIYQNGKLAIETYTGNRTGESLQGAVETAKQQERHYLGQQREKEKKQNETMNRKAASKKLFEEFSQKNGVQEWVSKAKLFTNPFIYEGKTIGTRTNFERMLSATEGVFDMMNYPFIVSNIPRGFFKSGGEVLLAANVIGSKEINIPMIGKTTVPHLRFVGGYQCRNHSCEEMLLWIDK